MSTTNPLRRSRSDRLLGGVLGGVAKHYDLDPVTVRVVYVILSVLSAAFPGILIYLGCWIVIPEE